MHTLFSPAWLVKVFFLITVGSLLYAIAFNWFFQPNELAFGGFTGVAQVVHFLAPMLPVGTVTLVMNIPLFVIGVRKMGWKLLAVSLGAMAASSLLVDIVGSLFTFAPMEPLLACLYGGALQGLALGLMLLVNATTGGTELLARLLKFRFRHLSIGRLCLMIDLVVIFLYALVFRNVNNALYGIIALTISSKVMDMVIYGSASAKMAYIISDAPDAICSQLLDMGLGITLLQGKGAYTGAAKKVILCAFKRGQIAAIKAVVMAADPHAFLIVGEAHEILGEGFGEYSSDSL